MKAHFRRGWKQSFRSFGPAGQFQVRVAEAKTIRRGKARGDVESCSRRRQNSEAAKPYWGSWPSLTAPSTQKYLGLQREFQRPRACPGAPGQHLAFVHKSKYRVCKQMGCDTGRRVSGNREGSCFRKGKFEKRKRCLRKKCESLGVGVCDFFFFVTK